ncbi:adenylate/guanylate cyclase domain-containing protein [Microvirga ossetica]|uniref:adenylate/guanylate cyclase domain-containing protein n=1 Tax=Microvirga ossetica TaxID=1882682 RepID=UPI0012FFE3E6|nr:adenylate/guanylate cyclase domain-containing protein [Microvirga ossetica]
MSAAAGAERRLAAILAADVVGSSRLMEADEAYALAAIHAALHDVLIATAARHGGRVFKTIGDGALIEFASAVAAVTCAHEVQKTLSERSAAKPEDKQVRLRIGINLGDVVARPDGDLYGDGINIAARLEPMASPGGIVISAKVYDELQGRLALAWQDWGEQTLKNITRPVRVYASGHTSASPARPTPSSPTKPSIAVLPFSNMSGDPKQEYFADGIVEDIITALSRVRWLFVIARNSSFSYKNNAIDAHQIGRDLGVRYLLEGSIRKAGQRVRISGQPLEAATGAHLWADRFDGEISEIFELQDRITTSVMIAVEPSLRLAEIERAQRKPTDNLDAYDLYLRALPAINIYTRAGFEEAEGLLRRAVALDPTYGDALAALAECLVRMVVNGWAADKQASTAEACALAGRAVTADPENASVLAVAAWAYSTLGVRFEQSLDLANRALAIHPNSVHVRSFCGWVFHYMGDSLRAIEQFEEARRLSPVDPKGYFPMLGLAAAHFFAGHFDETVTLTSRVLAEVPTHNVARRYRAAALAHLGRMDEA